jgi:hypothetical protein
VEGNPTAQAELAGLGVPLVPAVAMGKRAVHGWNPPAYAALLGVPYRQESQLPPGELARRLDRILESAERLIAEVPDSALGVKAPGRDRSIRQLAHHIFRLSLAFVDGMDMGAFPETWLQEPVPADLRDGPAIARYGALVRGRIGGWLEGAGDRELARTVQVYYGPQSGHDLLERTTWHAAQHLRQLYALAEQAGVRPGQPLPEEEFRGLPLPESLW